MKIKFVNNLNINKKKIAIISDIRKKDEQTLFSRAKSGDGSAFREIFDNYQKRVYGVAVGILGNNYWAEEATQELTLAPGASDTVTFTVTREDAGTYSVEMDGLTGEFTVKAHPFPWALVGSIIGGVLGLLAVTAITVYLVFFRRRRAAA